MSAERWMVFARDFEVSDLGRLRRVTAAPGARVGAILRPTPASNGYASFKIRGVDGKRHTVFVHHAVAVCFIGPRPDGYQVNHKDGDKLNNAASNLEYVTAAGNSRHAVEHGLIASGDRHRSRTRPDSVERGASHWTSRRPELIKVGEDTSGAVLTEPDVVKIRELLARGERVAVVASRFPVSKGAIYHIRRGTTWGHVR